MGVESKGFAVMEHFDNLPLELSLRIFSLVPVESVPDCALVSKSWKNFIHSPSFLDMHKDHLTHLVLQARAELVQKVKETEEYSKSVKKLEQACQSMDLLEQTLRIHNDNLVERINSIRLTDEKLKNYLRLAEKCVKIVTGQDANMGDTQKNAEISEENASEEMAEVVVLEDTEPKDYQVAEDVKEMVESLVEHLFVFG